MKGSNFSKMSLEVTEVEVIGPRGRLLTGKSAINSPGIDRSTSIQYSTQLSPKKRGAKSNCIIRRPTYSLGFHVKVIFL